MSESSSRCVQFQVWEATAYSIDEVVATSRWDLSFVSAPSRALKRSRERASDADTIYGRGDVRSSHIYDERFYLNGD